MVTAAWEDGWLVGWPSRKGLSIGVGTSFYYSLSHAVAQHEAAASVDTLADGRRRSANCTMLRVAIVGAGGYIGSSLQQALSRHCNWNVTGYDREPRLVRASEIEGLAARHILTSDLRGYDAVIYLGGLTGRAACNEQAKAVRAENVDDPGTCAGRSFAPRLCCNCASVTSFECGVVLVHSQMRVARNLTSAFSSGVASSAFSPAVAPRRPRS